MNKKGFTLIEVLVSIVVMGVIAAGTYKFMASIVVSGDIIEEKTSNFLQLQKCINLLDNDFAQMVPRASRMEGITTKKMVVVGEKIFQSSAMGISFSRGGSLNPGALLPRSEIVRVWYRVKDKRLQRASYPFSDTVMGFEPEYIDLLDDVKDFKILFYKQGQWIKNWDNNQFLPTGVKIELETSNYGKIIRVYRVIAGGNEIK